MTIDEKASLFPIYSQWRNAYLSHTSPFFHLICMQIKHPMQMEQAGEERGLSNLLCLQLPISYS